MEQKEGLLQAIDNACKNGDNINIHIENNLFIFRNSVKIENYYLRESSIEISFQSNSLLLFFDRIKDFIYDDGELIIFQKEGVLCLNF